MKSEIRRVADLRQQVYETLRKRITDGHFKTDARFQEIKLADELGVSRTPVREALAMLVRDGLLVQGTRSFTFPKFSAQNIADTIEVRLLLEPYAIRRMIEERRAHEMKSLGQKIRTLLSVDEDLNNYPTSLRQAREAIYEKFGNKELVKTLKRFEDSAHFIRNATLRNQKFRRISFDGMMQLAHAIEVGDPDKAEVLMKRQLANLLQAYLAFQAEAEKTG